MVSISRYNGEKIEADWWCNNDQTGRCSIDSRLRIAGKSQAEISAQFGFSVIIFRGIISPSFPRVQTIQEGGGIQF